MALLFDEIDDKLVIADNAALTFPDADWTLSGWVKLANNAGSLYQFFLSWGLTTYTPSINWWIAEASEASTPNKLGFRVIDNDGTDSSYIYSTLTPGTSTDWQHFLLLRNGNSIQQYINGVVSGTYTNAAFDAIDRSDSLYLGCRSDLNADRFLGGRMAEWAKWDRALSSDEIAALAAGVCPRVFSPVWWMPMFTDAAEKIVPLSVTDNTSGVATHPTMKDPGRRRRLVCGAAA
jgi:hypothetical protein